jgi:magnesium chelatase family protein
MVLARTRSVAVVGVQGYLIDIEADLADGLPGVRIVGLPDAALHEARDRIRSAVVNSNLSWPSRKITIGLLPASMPKGGSQYDLALALAVLAAAGEVPGEPLADVAILCELGLSGQVRPVRGVLPAVTAAVTAGVRKLMVPAENFAEAALVSDIQVRGMPTLTAAVAWLRGEQPDEPVRALSTSPPLAFGSRLGPVPPVADEPDLAQLAGQHVGRRALEVAAAGGHHLFMVGPPGAGKTMLAERLPGLLPPLEDADALEVTSIHSIAGTLPADKPLIRLPPYQAPHHTASIAALVGGGSRLAGPGAITLAHRGVLFLDEAPEFPPPVLEALRQPLERGEVVLARSAGITRYPARCQLVLAANPCPCASASGDQACVCPSRVRARYLARLSGPLLDRIDIQVDLLPVAGVDLLGDGGSVEDSATVAKRVLEARRAALRRLSGTSWRTNSEVPGHELRTRWQLPRKVRHFADMALDLGQVSARGYDRILKIAWSIGDLAGHTSPDASDVDEAVGMRLRHQVAA